MTRGTFLAALALAAVCVLPYARSLSAPYVWDDADELVGNFALRDARNLPKLLTRSYYDVTRAGPACYRPVKALSLFLTENVLGAGPAAQRLSNAALNFCVALLLLAFARIFLAPEAALAAALLFAAHPVHSEAILCVVFRDEPLACLFFLAALLLVRRRREGWALAAYALALFSKESAIVLPVIAALAEWAVPPREKTAPPRIFYAGAAVLAAAFLAVRLFVLRDPAQAVPYPGGTLYTNVLSMTPVLAAYLKLLAWPAHLSIAYDFPILHAPNMTFLLAAGGLAAAAAAVAASRDRKIIFFSAWILLCLAPVMNVIPFLLYSLLFERYLYMPSAGFCLLAAYLLARLPRRAFVAAVAVLVVAGTWRTAARADDWRCAAVLYAKDAARFPGSFALPVFVGRDLLERGDADAAIPYFRRSLELNPDYDGAHNALGAALAEKRDYAGAIREFSAALKSRPDYPTALDNLAAAYFESGKFEEADSAARRAAALKPTDPAASENLVLFSLRRGRLDEALALDSAALAGGLRSPRLDAYRGMILSRSGRGDEALRAFEDAVALAPEDPAMHDYLGVAEVEAGRGAEGVAEFDRALALDPSYAPAIADLAATYSRGGRRQQALETIDSFLRGGVSGARRKDFEALRARIAGS